MTPGQAADVIGFWFGDGTAVRDVWFRKDAAFDDGIRQRFGGLIDAELAAPTPPVPADDDLALARLLVLDQFTRNVFRDTPRAFAGDAAARVIAQALVDTGRDRAMPPLRRWFAYLPFEHAEDLAAQDLSVRLYTALLATAGEHREACALALDYAHRHRDVIVRFGRYPHRNAILGRASTAEEQAFLAQPGSRF